MISDSVGFKVFSKMGLWTKSETFETKFQNYLYLIYFIFNIFIYAMVYVLQLIFVIIKIHENNLNLAIDTLVLNNAFLFIILKLKLILFDKSKILNLESQLNNPLWIAKSNSEIMIQKLYVKKANFLSYGFGLTLVFLAILCCVSPALSEIDMELPFNMWFPFKITKSNYWIIYMFESIFILHSVPVNSMTDCIFVDFILHGCLKLKILGLRLQMMPEEIELSRKKNMKNEDILIIETNFLRSLIEQHQLIYK